MRVTLGAETAAVLARLRSRCDVVLVEAPTATESSDAVLVSAMVEEVVIGASTRTGAAVVADAIGVLTTAGVDAPCLVLI